MICAMGIREFTYRTYCDVNERSLLVRAALVLAAFTTALAFSVILPSLPSRIAALAKSEHTKTLRRHTGLIASVYAQPSVDQRDPSSIAAGRLP